ncbi:MAG TPA: hypothetical protein PLD12_10810 [Bacteroidales bacterium]|nr:hypothetical protein [Bacteroidales bacterium]HOK99620.1 hypothetical protein [Bacteroidales bacterium]HPO66452.1 hypothetical protein [Bacteroidales bacterium]
MNCEQCRKLLIIEGLHRLSNQQKQEVREHIAGCADCAEWYKLETRLVAIASETANLQVSLQFVNSVMDRVKEIELSAGHQAREFNFSWLTLLRAVAAGLLIIVALASGIFLGQLTRQENATPFELSALDDSRLETIFMYNDN